MFIEKDISEFNTYHVSMNFLKSFFFVLGGGGGGGGGGGVGRGLCVNLYATHKF